MKKRDRRNLPEDIDDEERYLKVTIYFDPESNQCCISASDALREEDILDILSSGIAELTEESTPEDTGYLN